jgi:uncharacterized protein
MAFSLYAATIPSFQQILGSVSGLLDKADAFCTEKAVAPQELIQGRLAADMFPLAYQVKSTSVHSLGAIEGIRKGVFSPDTTSPPETFAALKARIAETLTAMEKIDSAEIDGFLGRDVRFAFGTNYRDYSAENFLLSFSLPNFYFHATTSYDILRWKGVPIGKRDYMGKTRTNK